MNGWMGWFRKSHFAPAFFVLPPPRRKALQILYAVCRFLDDAVDNRHPQVQEILRSWRQFFVDQNVTLLRPWGQDALGAEFVSVMKEYDIPSFSMTDLIDKGVSVDLAQNRFETPMDFESYCYGVAGTVGIACLPIFGVPWQEAKDFAVRLGISVQWINAIRDVGADAKLNRIYVPLDHLEKFQISEADIINGKRSPQFLELMKYEAEVARSNYRRALELLPQKWQKELRPALIMGEIYLKLLVKLEKQAYPVFEKRVALNVFEKILVPWKVMTN